MGIVSPLEPEAFDGCGAWLAEEVVDEEEDDEEATGWEDEAVFFFVHGALDRVDVSVTVDNVVVTGGRLTMAVEVAISSTDTVDVTMTT